MILNNISDEHKKISFQNELIENYISVIIPVYKDSVGLEETLKSLKKQTLSDQEYEIIVANDGADKEINIVCNKYNVKMVSIFPNQGSYYARNRALEMSKGEFLAFVDADIMVSENWLEKGKVALLKYDYVAGNVIIDKSKIKNVAHYYEYCYGFPIRTYLLHNHFGVTANIFVKRKVFEEIGGFDQRLKSGGDKEFGDRVYRSKKFRQIYKKDVLVIHPPRGYKNLIKKIKRVTQGNIKLNQLYPIRFKIPKFSESIISIFVHTPERKLELGRLWDFKLYVFASFINCLRCFYFIKLDKNNVNN